ncbi:hypothetical protein R50072_05170 [Simiduia litorea]|uniref:hypothetical protein n=1 Tax=Simiduia litorea TaxID=1435348 RepID=UPI0036F2A3DE
MKRWIAFIAVPFIIYPMALGMVILSDTVLGESEFLRHFFLESKRETLHIILQDWGSALPYCLPLWVLMAGLEKIANRTWANSTGIVIALGVLGTSFLQPTLPLIFACIALATIICALISQYLLKEKTR